VGLYHLQNLGGQAPGNPHLFDFGRGFDADAHRIWLGQTVLVKDAGLDGEIVEARRLWYKTGRTIANDSQLPGATAMESRRGAKRVDCVPFVFNGLESLKAAAHRVPRPGGRKIG
jgi:hypothetical protein